MNVGSVDDGPGVNASYELIVSVSAKHDYSGVIFTPKPACVGERPPL